ncbi:MAG: hypothetical protein HN849_30560 [Victivallales bacterium]|jgi:hypothetical protein|nr:hypothetical protein [Victivallales bacterium]
MTAAPTKESLLAEILGHPDEAIRTYRGGGVPSAVLRELAAEAQHPDLRRFLAAYPETPARILEQLAAGDEPETVREALAAHPRAPRAVLMQLVSDPAVAVRLAVAANRALTPQVALQLAEDEAVAVRLALAGNAAISPRAQAQLAADPSSAVRSALLGKARLDAETQRLLAEADDPLLRAETIATAEANDSALLAWADSDQFVAQTALLLRSKLPGEVLESLCFSTHPVVQRHALERHHLSTDETLGWSQSEQPSVRVLIAERPGLPPGIQRLLAGDAIADVRRALAGNADLHEAVAGQLAEDLDPAVQTALALNTSLLGDALSVLCQSPSVVVRKLVATRPELTIEQVALLLGDGNEEVAYHLARNDVLECEVPPEMARSWVTHRLPSLRALAASSADLAEPAMASLARDPAPMVRRALAWNPVLPGALRAQLTEDVDYLVAQRAHVVTTEPSPPDTPSQSAPKGFLKRLLDRILDRDHNETQ